MAALLRAREAAVGLDDVADFNAMMPSAMPADAYQFFRNWIDEDSPPQVSRMSLLRTLYHLNSFWQARPRGNIVMLHYQDLMDTSTARCANLPHDSASRCLEILWPQLVQAATFSTMRERADVLAPDTSHAQWHDNKNFFRTGTSGQWQGLLRGDDLDHYWERVAEFATPDLASDWAHRTTT